MVVEEVEEVEEVDEVVRLEPRAARARQRGTARARAMRSRSACLAACFSSVCSLRHAGFMHTHFSGSL